MTKKWLLPVSLNWEKSFIELHDSKRKQLVERIAFIQNQLGRELYMEQQLVRLLEELSSILSQKRKVEM